MFNLTAKRRPNAKTRVWLSDQDGRTAVRWKDWIKCVCIEKHDDKNRKGKRCTMYERTCNEELRVREARVSIALGRPTMNNQSSASASNSAMSPSAAKTASSKTPASAATSTGAYDDAHRISPAGKLVLRGGLKRKHT